MTATAGDYRMPQSVMQAYFKKGLNPYNSQNLILIQDINDNLEKAITSFDNGDEDQALKLLEALVPALLMAKLMGERMKENYAKDENNAHVIADVLIRCTANLLQHEAEIRKLIAETKARIEGDRKKVELDQDAQQKLMSQINQLQRDIDDFNDRCDEAAKWSWVPGYNVYLACRTLRDAIEGKFQQLNSNKEELGRLLQESNMTQAELAQLIAGLDRMQKDTERWADQEKALKEQQTAVEEQMKFYSGRTVFASDIALFFAHAGIATQSLTNNLDSVMAITGRLKEQVKIYNTDGTVGEGTLKEALLVAGKAADLWNAQHQHW